MSLSCQFVFGEVARALLGNPFSSCLVLSCLVLPFGVAFKPKRVDLLTLSVLVRPGIKVEFEGKAKVDWKETIVTGSGSSQTTQVIRYHSEVREKNTVKWITLAPGQLIHLSPRFTQENLKNGSCKFGLLKRLTNSLNVIHLTAFYSGVVVLD